MTWQPLGFRAVAAILALAALAGGGAAIAQADASAGGGETLSSTDAFATGANLIRDREALPGAALYGANCAMCHNGGLAKAPHRQWLELLAPAAIVSDLRVINGNRGKLIIFKLDDKTDPQLLEASCDEALYNANRNLIKDDELVIVQGTLQPGNERFGRRFKVTQVFDLETARCKFGKYLRVAVNGVAPDISRLIRDFPPRNEASQLGDVSRSLPVRVSLRREHARAEIQLGEPARFFPTDAALASWMAQADKGLATIVYE